MNESSLQLDCSFNPRTSPEGQVSIWALIIGASLLAEEEAIVKLLTQLLIERGVKNDPFKIKLLLKFLRKQGFSSIASTVFDVKTWDQEGEKIWETASSGDTNAAEVMTTWSLM